MTRPPCARRGARTRLGDHYPKRGAAALREPGPVGGPFVRRYRDTFHLWYIFGTGWRKFARDAGDWDSEMQCYPHVFACDGRTRVLHDDNELGRHGFGLAALE